MIDQYYMNFEIKILFLLIVGGCWEIAEEL